MTDCSSETVACIVGAIADAKQYRPYPTYMDSGVEWLGKIPKNWGVMDNRWLFRESDARSEYGAEELLTVSHISGVTRRADKPDVTMMEAESHEGYKLCSSGDLAINTMWAWMGALGVAREDGMVSPSYNVYRIIWTGLVPGYYDYLCRAPAHIVEITRHSKGIWSSRLRLYPDTFRNIQTPVPPRSEQRRITKFLDQTTANIDALVAKKERLIELLHEKRTALITRSVTKGIDLDAPMKDSGVKWLADIPERWNAARMWQLSEAISGGTPPRHESRYWGGSIPWVSPKDMKRRLLDDSEEKITERGRIEGGLRLVRPPAILIVVRGMILAHSFPVALVTVPLTINQDMKALKLGERVDARYFGWLLDGISHQILATTIEKSGHGTRAVRMDQWRSVELPLPPILEQRSIADFLDRETTKMDGLVTKVREAIDRLKELRTALIAAAVTGKIDVRKKPA